VRFAAGGSSGLVAELVLSSNRVKYSLKPPEQEKAQDGDY
jgi:hypothetical protein